MPSLFTISLFDTEKETLIKILLDVREQVNKDYKNSKSHISKDSLGYTIYQINEIIKQLDKAERSD